MAWELTFDQTSYKLPSSFRQQAETQTCREKGRRGREECGGTDEVLKEQRAGRQKHTGRQVCSSDVLLTATRQSHGDTIWQE